VALARDDMPLRLEPSVAVLLQALRIAVRPEAMSSGQAMDLPSGPLCGFDADQLRRWGRAQRQARRQEDPSGAIPAADQLMRDVLRGEENLVASEDTEVRVRNLQRLVAAAHAQIRSHATPAEVLWTLWSGEVDGIRTHGWPERLRSAALRDSRTANHDLDAVMALFDAAERFAGRNRGAAGVRDFLDSLAAQELPAEPVAERAIRSEAVRVLTAHRAKGLEWAEVWVVGAQDGVWPDIRARGSVLEPERLTPDGLGTGVLAHELLDEERRLFYVACTRARQRVHIAVVDAADDLGDRPSRFITELIAHGVPVQSHGHAPSTACSTMPALLAQLRTALSDPLLGDQAAALLAELAAARDDDDEPLVPLADPNQWWGRYRPTTGEHPIVQPDDPVRLSGSSLELVTTCPRRWFLERHVHASMPTGTPAATGNVVHSIAEFVGRDEVPADLEAMDHLVDQVWHELRFEAPWQSQTQRAEAREALERFLAYHLQAARELVDSEQQLTSQIEVPTPSGGREQVFISGFIDRLERASDGSVVPVDLKTQRTVPTQKELTQHAQLGLYQLLVQRQGDEPGGGVLVQLRHGARGSTGLPKEQVQVALPTDAPNWVETQLGVAAETIRSADFPARKSSICRHCQFRDSCPAQPAGQPMDGIAPS
jgi:RecB family exonuclease